MAEPNGDFHAVVLRVRSLGPGGPPTLRYSDCLHGWLYREVLREGPGPEPGPHGGRGLSLSPLLEATAARPAAAVRAGESYAFRVSFLEAAGYRAWRRWTLSLLESGACVPDGSPSAGRMPADLPPEARSRLLIPLHSGAFVQPLELEGWTEDPRDHPMAGRATAGELERWGEQHAGEPLALAFLSPTLFRSSYELPGPAAGPRRITSVDVPLPDPVRLFKSLAGRWQLLAPPGAAIPEGLLEVVRETTCVSRCDVRTERVALNDGETRGFVGQVEFRCLAPVPEAALVFATLWRFAELAGVGVKTAHGMGLVRLLPARSRP